MDPTSLHSRSVRPPRTSRWSTKWCQPVPPPTCSNPSPSPAAQQPPRQHQPPPLAIHQFTHTCTHNPVWISRPSRHLAIVLHTPVAYRAVTRGHRPRHRLYAMPRALKVSNTDLDTRNSHRGPYQRLLRLPKCYGARPAGVPTGVSPGQTIRTTPRSRLFSTRGPTWKDSIQCIRNK